MAFGAAAHADSFTVEFNTEFSGADEPEGSTPWLVMTIDDGGTAGTVLMTLEATNLTDDEFVRIFNFNVTGQIYGSHTANSTVFTNNGCGLFSEDGFKADGAGYFDYECTFAANDFGVGDVFEVLWSLPATLTAADFFLFSTTSSKGEFLAAAHVQGIGDNDGGSGWITGGGDSHEVPEPGTLALFGLGLTMMGVATRRRRVAPKA